MSVRLTLESMARWLVNVSLRVLVLKRRDQNLWIFGAWRGKQYSDNSKYFFEYVQMHMPEIRAVWITKTGAIKEQLSAKGIECYLSDEKQARKLRLNAGFVFYTNGMLDFGNVDLCHGAKKVALWHGMPLKRLCYATNNLQKRTRNPIRFIQYLTLKIYHNAQRNITIATSERTKEFLIECFEVNPEQVFITGQPRNEALFREDIKAPLLARLKHQSNEKFILYMPTWRESDLKGKSFLKPILKNLFRDTEFAKTLIDKNIKLYIKPHPNVDVHYNNQGNIIIIDFDIDTQELMAVADTLITDYSSAFIDYALRERPIHYFVPDMEEYASDKLGLFISFHELADFWFQDTEVLKKVVLNDDEYQKPGLLNTSRVNKIYDDPSLERGKYNEALLEVLKTKYL